MTAILEVQEKGQGGRNISVSSSQRKKNFSFWKIFPAFLAIVVIGEGVAYLFLKKESSPPATGLEVVQEEKIEQQEKVRFFCPVPQVYCGNFETIVDPFAGILLPEGTEIFAALSGRVSIMSDGVGNIIVEIMSLPSGKPAEKFFYYFGPSVDLLVEGGGEVEKGALVAKAPHENVGGFQGSYSLVISATDSNGNFYSDPTLLFSE